MRIRPLSPRLAENADVCRVLMLCTAHTAKSRRSPYTLPDGQWALVQKWMARIGFSGRRGEHAHFTAPHDGPHREYLLIGYGDDATFSPTVARKLGGLVTKQLCALGVRRALIHLSNSGNGPWSDDAIRTLACGLIEGRSRTRPELRHKNDWQLLYIAGTSRPITKALLHEGAEMGDAINRIRPIANSPGNLGTPGLIVAAARRLARLTALRCTVWDKKRLERERCNALLAVAQGSANQPYLIQLTHPGERNTSLKPLVVVGKTITFDTGGISLKPGKNMEWMKFDKSGGMAVLALMRYVATALRPARPVIGILAVAENMPDAGATRPGDVVKSRSGKSIEIVNTDAEGRLVLADALDVAQDHDPVAVVDLATLTAAASVALGKQASALLSNDSYLVESLREAGEASGERLWPLPLFEDYKSLLDTPFADIKNIGDGTAGTIVGGIFLQHFIRRGIRWAHIDLTSAWNEYNTSHGPAGATLFGAALLGRWLAAGYLDRIPPR